MQAYRAVLAFISLTVLVATFGPPLRQAWATTSTPVAAHGCVQIPADAGMLVGSQVIGRSGVLIQNKDSASIYWQNGTTTFTDGGGGGFAPALASAQELPTGQSIPVTTGYQQTGMVDIYVYSAAGTSACSDGGGVRWYEGRGAQ